MVTGAIHTVACLDQGILHPGASEYGTKQLTGGEYEISFMLHLRCPLPDTGLGLRFCRHISLQHLSLVLGTHHNLASLEKNRISFGDFALDQLPKFPVVTV